MNPSTPIILASTSQIRQQLLRNAGVVFTALSSGVDESLIKEASRESSPAMLAAALATAKSTALCQAHPGALIIGADQLLVLDGKTFDKPSSIPDARLQLQALRNRSHQLISAISCSRSGATLWQHQSAATLTMRPFTDEFLDHYITRGGTDLLTSVGAYKLEGRGIQLFETISGDYFTILGLPLLPLLAFLRGEGLLES